MSDKTALALKKLSDSSFQKMAAVNESNTFVFASMQMSELKVSRWHVRKDVCAEIKLQNASTNIIDLSVLMIVIAFMLFQNSFQMLACFMVQYSKID